MYGPLILSNGCIFGVYNFVFLTRGLSYFLVIMFHSQARMQGCVCGGGGGGQGGGAGGVQLMQCFTEFTPLIMALKIRMFLRFAPPL